MLKDAVKRMLRAAGLDVVRYHPRSHVLARRMKLIGSHEINLLFDVGANVGQYALEMRRLGYHGRIVSFEPLLAPFYELKRRTNGDHSWTAIHAALGDVAGMTSINVAGNSQSSSMLPMLPAHLRSAPNSAYIGVEHVPVTTLAAAIAAHAQSTDRLFVKIDAQGYEKHILDGAGDSLPRVVGLQLEMSLVPLYEGETLLPQMVELVAKHGFTLMSLEPGFGDERTGQLLQADGIFFRR